MARMTRIENPEQELQKYQKSIDETNKLLNALQNKNAAEYYRTRAKGEADLAKSEANRLKIDYDTQLNNLFKVQKAKEQSLTELSKLENALSEENVKAEITSGQRKAIARKEADLAIARQENALAEANAKAAMGMARRDKLAKTKMLTELADLENENKNLIAQRDIAQLHYTRKAKEVAEGEITKKQIKNKELIAQIEATQTFAQQNIEIEAETKVHEQRLANIQQLQQAQADALAARQQYLNQDTLAELAAKSLADMRAQTEKTRLELAVQEKIRHDTTLHAESLALQRTQTIAKERMDLNKQIDEALLAEDEDLTTKRGRYLAQRAKNEAAAQKADKEVNDYLNKLPLIGIKLGQRGNILDAFKDLSKVTDETTGKVWSLSKANQAWKSFTPEQQQKGSELADKIGAAQKKAATGDEKAQETMDLVKAFQESQKTLTDALKAQESTEKSGSDEDKKKATDAVEAAKAQVEEQAKALGKNLDVDGVQVEDLNAAETKMAKKGTGAAALAKASAAIASLAQKLEGQADSAALLKAKADTRLYGSGMATMLGSYWSKIAFDIAPTMISPFLKEEDLVNNIQTAIGKGIAKDAAQIGLLETLKDKIAQTFDAFDTTVRRLVRIQDMNTTAARMGMEASLNEFLNGMYETTEYLSDIAASVRGSLEEAEALMSGDRAVAFEYQVQKWLGSLYSSGVSQSGVTAISDALGKLAAGDIQGIVNGGAGNLLIMAANNANLSISDILADGLDASETNVLLKQMVSYMGDLVSEANGNLVVQQELAKVFGLSASDLKAAANTLVDANTISKQGATNTYNAMLGNLFSMADSMAARTSLGEMMSNIWANVNYATATAMGTNPVFYVLNKVADIMNTFAGGIPIPMISVMGNTVDTKLKIADILNMTSVLGGFTQSLIGMFASMGQGGSGFGSGLLKMVGISDSGVRGSGSGKGSSSSGTVSTYSGGGSEDIQEGAMSEGKDKNKKESTTAEEEKTEVTTETINDNIVNIYNLLQDVVSGASSFHMMPVTESSMGWS